MGSELMAHPTQLAARTHARTAIRIVQDIYDDTAAGARAREVRARAAGAGGHPPAATQKLRGWPCAQYCKREPG